VTREAERRRWAAARPAMPEPMTAAFMAAVPGKKNAAKRPETKEGGREEEKSRLGIASGTRGSG
jgi:hypothetical protein